MTQVERAATLRRYADGELTAEAAADLLGTEVSVAEVVLATAARCGRLPDPTDAFTEGEFRRALGLLEIGSSERAGEAR